MKCSLLSAGILAPGLPDWATACRVLRGQVPYRPEPIDLPAPRLLRPNERRRATPSTRLALEVARQATADLDLDPGELVTVFASSEGDLELVDRMCTDLYKHHTGISPTAFHNSVHNAVAGYWSIGNRCHRASTSIAGWDETFAIGLLEACAQAVSGERPVLLVAYDVSGPEFLASHRHFAEQFACALLLSSAAGQASLASPLMSLSVSLDGPGSPPELQTMAGQGLDVLRMCNPAARALPLLDALANARPGSLRLAYQDDLDLVVTLS